MKFGMRYSYFSVLKGNHEPSSKINWVFVWQLPDCLSVVILVENRI